MRNRLQINFLICKIEKTTFNVERSRVWFYHGCRVTVNKSSCTIQVKKHKLRKIFHKLTNFGADFSKFLSKKLGQKYRVLPKIVNVQASKILNLERKSVKLQEFLLHIHENISSVVELRIAVEDTKNPDIYRKRAAIEQIKQGFGLYMSILIRGEGFCCKIQISKSKNQFVTAFVFSHFGSHIQKLIEDLNEKF